MKNKTYYARIKFNDLIRREDKVFACLLCCGYPASQAYQIAYPTKADVNSTAAMASRKVNSWAIQQVLRHFKRLYDTDSVGFPYQLIKN